jgi:cytochrome c biogenesis protein ResB
MRTAIILLAVLALLATVGTLLPQIPQNPQGVMGFVLRHPYSAPWLARLGLFDIFSSWPFLITACLMYISIGASMFIRVPAAWRRFALHNQRNRALFAEVASIVFHASFFLLLIGVLVGKAAGFVGNAAVVDVHEPCTGGLGKLGRVVVPCLPRREVGVDEYAQLARRDGFLRSAGGGNGE